MNDKDKEEKDLYYIEYSTFDQMIGGYSYVGPLSKEDADEQRAFLWNRKGNNKVQSISTVSYKDVNDNLIVCSYCGGKDRPGRWDNEIKDRMHSEKRCFSCIHWFDAVEQKDDDNCAIIDGNIYWVKDLSSTRHKVCLGFGGRVFHVEWHNGRKKTSNNVWHGGEIPKRFCGLLQNNAKFVSGTGKK